MSKIKVPSQESEYYATLDQAAFYEDDDDDTVYVSNDESDLYDRGDESDLLGFVTTPVPASSISQWQDEEYARLNGRPDEGLGFSEVVEGNPRLED
jgi:hypothetical protein